MLNLYRVALEETEDANGDKIISNTAMAWECWVAGSEHASPIIAFTRGRAKSRYQHDQLYDLDIPYTSIRAKCLGPAHAPRGERLMEVARRRGLSFVHPGMAIEVDGKRGRVWDGNDSGNFDVLFDGSDCAVNCHPWWMTRYFDSSGNVLADYTREK